MAKVKTVIITNSEILTSIKKGHPPYLKWIEDMEEVLLENIKGGDQVKKSLIPSKYKDGLGVNNLYRYYHPEGFRSCYTISFEEGLGNCPHILDIMDHDEYNRLFGYRKTR